MSLTLAEEIRKCDTEKLIGILEHHLYLDGDDLSIIREKKITGRIFFKLTENKLEKWGIPDGSALAIVDFINELTSEEKECSSKRRKVEDVKTSSTTAMNISSGISSFFHDSDIENWSLIGCLDHLVKMGVNLTSEDREEFIEEYKAQLLSLNSRQSMLQKARNKARKLAEKAERTFQREEIASFFKKLDTLSVTSATLDLANATDDLANAKGNLFETKLKVDAYNKIITREPLSTDENPTRKRKHSNRLETPPRRSPNNDSLLETPPRRPPNNDALLDTPNKRQMSDEKVIQYLNAMEQSLEYGQVTVQRPSLWTEPLNSYIDNVLKKSDDFKMEILRKIKGDEGNMFRLYCEKILMDFYNLVDVFPNLSRKIGERKYIVQNVSSLFKFYESTFGNLHFDWIETHSPASKLTKSRTYSGIVKVDAKGVRVFDDKEIFHAEVSGPPSSSTSQHGHAVNDTTKSIHTDILNLIAILLDHLRAPVENATKIKVFSLQAIEYRITLYSLNMSKNGTFLTSELYSTLLPFSFDAISKYKGILYMMAIFHEEITKQISVMKDLDLTIDHNEGSTVRDVLKIPKSLKDLLRLYQ